MKEFYSLLFLFLLAQSVWSQHVVINEFMSSNRTTITDEDGDYADWIELFNYGETPVDLAGFGLSDNPNNLFKWVLPDVTLLPKSYLLVWASNKNRINPAFPLHTNFAIAAEGERLSLTHPSGSLLDAVEKVHVPSDVSYGRGIGDHFDTYFFYYTPTPNGTNATSPSSALVTVPEFSHPSGFYPAEFSLTLSHPDPDAVILYTLDGSDPKSEHTAGTRYFYKNQYAQLPGQSSGPFLTNTVETLTYTTPIALRDRSTEPNKLASISSTWNYTPSYIPREAVKKATVVRARAFSKGVMSPPVTHTYFISSTAAFHTDLPILSITVDETDFFDYDKGIYVAGVDFDDWRSVNPSHIPNGNTESNYQRRGAENEINAHIAYFVSNEEQISQDIGIRIHGGISRSFPVKSLRLYARSEYGKNTLDYAFFDAYPYLSFKRLLVRNSGQDRNLTLFRDAFIQRLVAHLNFDTQQYQPLVHYLNGEYWGIANLRERFDKHYFKRVYAIEEDEIDLLEKNGEVQEGDNQHWFNFIDFITQTDLTLTDNFEIVKTFIDEKSFIDYQVANIFSANTDWPGNNIRFWRKKSEFVRGAPAGHDGRWRWLMYDTDFGFGLREEADHNTLAFATQPGGTSWPNQDWSTLVLRKLLENNEFKTEFVLRYADLLNTAFLPQRAIDLIDQMKAVIEPEIPKHRERWAMPTNWSSHVETMAHFAAQRPEFARQHLMKQFNLSDTYQLEIDVADTPTSLADSLQSLAGYIRVNTLDILPMTPGVSDTPYPWTGIYFNEIPISVTAFSLPGYAFSHWSGAVQSSDSTLVIRLKEDTQITAHFRALTEFESSEIIHFWLMDNNIPNNTPLTSLQATYTKKDKPGVIEYTSSLEGYPFVSGHPSWRKASMERRNSPSPLNYFPEASGGLAFEQVNMRGLQVKQPFQEGSKENTLNFAVSTVGFENINLSFAVLDEGAAEEISVMYFDQTSGTWSDATLLNAAVPIKSTYTVVEFDFSTVALAADNPNFLFRLRFTGNDMQRDNGDRVTFNNIALSGTPLMPAESLLVTSTTPGFRCDFGSVMLYATANAGEIHWFDEVAGGNALAVGESFLTPFLTENTIFYAEASTEAGVSPRVPVAATVVDDISPEISAKATYVLTLDSYGYASLSWEDIDEGSWDNCEIVERILSKNEFTREDLGEHDVIYTVKDASGNAAQAAIKVRVDLVLSTGTLFSEKQVGYKLFPNPAKNDLFVSFDEGIDLNQYEIELLDATGRSLGEFESFLRIEKGFELDISRLSNGLYILRISSDSSVNLLKFIIER
ncbi:MAG: CotH kinase family protein [Nitritalea sp.]